MVIKPIKRAARRCYKLARTVAERVQQRRVRHFVKRLMKASVRGEFRMMERYRDERLKAQKQQRAFNDLAIVNRTIEPTVTAPRRRAFFAGLAALAITAALPATVTPAEASIANGESGLNVRTYLNAKLDSIINVVVDYGALNDNNPAHAAANVTAIQNAFDAAFGPSSAPHGGASGSWLNRPVFFPQGNYWIDAPLTLTAVSGGWIFGAGREATKIEQLNPNTSVIVTNGMQYSLVQGIGFQGAGGTGTTHAAFDLNWDGIAGHDCALQSIRFMECNFGSAAFGINIGASGAMGSEMKVDHCSIDTCLVAGLAADNQNAVANWVMNCNVANCGIGVWAKSGGGSWPVIIGISFQQNAIADISINASSPDTYFISSCRSEGSFVFLQAFAADFSVQGNCHQARRVTVSGVSNDGGNTLLAVSPNAYSLQVGQTINVASIVGTGALPGAVNGNHTITALGASTITINVAFPSGTYTSGGIVTNDGTPGHFIEGLNGNAAVAANVSVWGDITGGGSLQLGPNSWGNQTDNIRTDFGIDSFGGTCASAPFRPISINYTTGPNALKRAKSGQESTNAGSAGAIEMQLPNLFDEGAAYEGTHFDLLVTAANSLGFRATNTRKIMLSGTFGSANGLLSSSTAGDWARVRAASRVLQNILGSSSGAGGTVRLQVAATSGLVTGDHVFVLGTSGGPTGINNGWDISVVDGTHIDLTGSVYGIGGWTGGTVRMPAFYAQVSGAGWTNT